MALSPWHVASRLSCEEVAALLGGYDITAAKAGYIRDHQLHELNEWGRIIVEAAQRRELTPVSVEVLEEEAEPDPIESCMTIKRYWTACDPDNLVWTFGYAADAVRLTLERQEVCRWLRASGIADDDIPEALRVMPRAKQTSETDELHPSREKTYQRTIAALVALQYGHHEIEQPFTLAEEVLADCQLKGVLSPAGRSTLGELFKQLPRVQKAPLD